MTNRQLLRQFYPIDEKKIKLRDHELLELLNNLDAQDVVGLQEHKHLIEVIAAFRRMIEKNNQLNGENFNATLKQLLTVGDDGIYSDELRFLFELIQNVDDCDYEDVSSAKLRIAFQGNTIQLSYNERGFKPYNVFAITGIAVKAKNVQESKVEIGEKGLGFKSVFGIADSVLIQSGYFSFRLNQDHFTVPIPEYDHYSPVRGTRMTLTLKSAREVEKICKEIKARYCKPHAIFRQNPMLFLNKLTELELLVDNASKQLLFVAERKEKIQLSDHLSVERAVNIEASLRSVTDQQAEDEFHQSITGTRYTYTTVYDRAMCQARYGMDTKLSQKSMTLQAIFPNREFLSRQGDQQNAIESGALYSFLPTQIAINAPIIVHAPFKLDGSREYVDAQGNNRWFSHTAKCLMAMLNESIAHMARYVHEDILLYIPKKHECIFSGAKTHSLSTVEYTGEKLLGGRIFWGADQQFHNRDEIKAYAGDLSVDEQKNIHAALKDSFQLFIVPQSLKALDYDIKVVGDPYRTLLIRAFYDVNIMQLALPILCDWIGKTSENELIDKLDEYIPISDSSAYNSFNYTGYKPTISLAHIDLISHYPVFAEPFCRWVQKRQARPDVNRTFKFLDTCRTCDITSIDPDSPFDLNDLGENTKRYLLRIKSRCILVEGNCICLPLNEAIILSRENGLDLFASFCKMMDKNTQFDITLRLLSNSRKLDDAESKLSTAEFLQLLRDVRTSGKAALGNSYHQYIKLLHQSGASPIRFINELFQNADDCDYPQGETPYLEIRRTDSAFSIHYNEVGFSKHNVRAITAIGESTKKQLLSGQTEACQTIGEKGIGFKSVFSIAKQVAIHSGEFHFGLRDSAPTIPILGIEEKYQGKPGTYIEMALKSHLPPDLLSKESLFALCLCLRKIKRITCGNTQIEIDDTPGRRRITVDGVPCDFTVFRHPFSVTDPSALEERSQGSRSISSEQAVCCYIPASNQRKFEYCLYNGLPTRVKINIPMYIDAPLELTTARDLVLENNWNGIVREHIYRAIYEYTNQEKATLQIRSLRFVAVKMQSSVYTNNTFEADNFLNAVSLKEYASCNVYVPAVNGWLRQPQATKKYPAFMRRMAAAMFMNTPEVERILNYSDDEYNVPYFYLGGKDAGLDDVLRLLEETKLDEVMENKDFRGQLYNYLEGIKGISEHTRTLRIIPVWDNVSGRTRYVSFDGKPVYQEDGKCISDNSDYWVLNEKRMTPTQFANILGHPVKTMDHDHAVLMYKKKLLAAVEKLSAQQAYQHLLDESRINPLLMEALSNMTADELRHLPLQNLNGEIVDSNQIFVLASGQNVFGRMLSVYIASPECYALAVKMHQKPLEEIQYGDVEDYNQILTSEDLEDLLKSEAPRLRYGRSIAREFYEQGRVEAKAAEEYGLVYVPVSVDTDVLHFPKACVNHPESLRAQMNDRINKAPKIISKVVEKKVRGWINPQSGEFCEFDQRAGRQEQLSNYSAHENADFCFCQMCEQPKRKEYIEVTCIQQEPEIFLPQIYLSLCLECSKRFQGLRSTKKSAFSKELTDKILSTKINGSGDVTIDMEGYISLKFTETHFAEMQAAISRLKLKESVSGIARPEPVSAVNEGRVVQPATHHAAVPKSFVCEDGGADKLAPAPNTATIRVHGEDAGLYKLVAYNGRLKKYTDKKPESRFIPLLRSGKERKVAVSLIREEQTIYISKENYVVFGKQLCQADDIELRYGAS